MDLLISIQVLILGIALTWAQQTTPDGCFQSWTNSAVTCLTPYDTRTGLSDQQCRDLCVQNPSTCKAVQYNANTRTCQLYQKSYDPQVKHGGWSHGGWGSGCGGSRSNSNSHEGGRGRPGRGPGGSGFSGFGGFPGGPGGLPGGPGGFRPGPGVPPPGRGKRQARGGRSTGTRHGGGGGGRSHGGGGRPCGSGSGGGCIPGLQTAAGSTYYKNTGQCNGGPFTVVTIATTQAPLPNGATCPTGQVVRYYLVENYQLAGTPDATFTAPNEQACIDACTNNRLPDGRQVPCKLFDFDTTSSKCSISFAGTGVAQVVPNGNIKHYEKTCVDSTFGNRCPGPYFRGPQRILIGYAQAVAGVSTAEECLRACSDSQARYNFACQSIMFYSQEATNNCILNSETRLNHPDLYNIENTDKVDYYEIGCAPIAAVRAAAASFKSTVTKRNRNVLVPNSNDYSGWTMCDRNVLDHRRFRRCRGMNANKCEVDKQTCDPAREEEYDVPLPATSIFTTTPSFDDDRCEPMIKPNGGRDCDNGTRRTRDGRREKCKPTKC